MPIVEYDNLQSGIGRLLHQPPRNAEGKFGILFVPGQVVFGKLRPYLRNWLLPDFTGIAVGDFWVLQPLMGDVRYLYWLIQSPRFLEAANISSGSKMPRADWKFISSTQFIVPSNEAEQVKITTLFSTLDSLIAAAERKRDLLKLKKQAYLQHMLPQNGEKQPRLRFKGFTGDWEQRQLKHVVSYRRPDAILTPDSQINKQGLYPVLTANKAFVLGYTDDSSHVSTDVPCIVFDDFTMESKYVDFPYSVRSSAIKLLYAQNDSTLYFIYEWLNQQHFPALGHARHYISFVQNRILDMPSTTEQHKIVVLLHTLDSLIAAAERKVIALKKLKQGYLQQMFV